MLTKICRKLSKNGKNCLNYLKMAKISLLSGFVDVCGNNQNYVLLSKFLKIDKTLKKVVNVRQKLSKFFKIRQKLSKLLKIVKIVTNCQN